MVKMGLKICHMYPLSMNIYGDTGNAITLKYRLEQRGLGAEMVRCEAGEKLPNDVDIIIAGGGQDSGQLQVEKDLQTKKRQLQDMVDDGVAMLVVCGTYQLFGHRFRTGEGEDIKGISVFDLETIASKERLIGNVVVTSDFGQLVGFENHSGKTFLAEGQMPLAKVVKGAGNNGQTGEEGAQLKNVFGTYMHGPLLPKNPIFADELLRRALERKYGKSQLTLLEDQEEKRAAQIAAKRPR